MKIAKCKEAWGALSHRSLWKSNKHVPMPILLSFSLYKCYMGIRCLLDHSVALGTTLCSVLLHSWFLWNMQIKYNTWLGVISEQMREPWHTNTEISIFVVYMKHLVWKVDRFLLTINSFWISTKVIFCHIVQNWSPLRNNFPLCTVVLSCSHARCICWLALNLTAHQATGTF